MNRMLKGTIALVLIGGLVVFTAWAGWWFLRWTTGVEVFELVRDHLRDSLGFSTAVAAVIAVGAGVTAAFLLTVLVINARFVLAAGLLIVALGLPLALWHDMLSADQCFNRQTGKPLCELWERPEGGHSIRRKDGRRPPSSWQLLRDATRSDVRAYLPTTGAGPVESLARVPSPIALESCTPWPTFFDAGNQAVVYWSRGTDVIELWDRRGPHPTTGKALMPMTSEIAVEVCTKLAAAKQQRQAKLEQERVALAAQQAAELAAEQMAQHQQKVQEEAQLRLEQQRQEEDRRATAARQEAEQSALQAAQLAQRLQKDQEEAQRRLDQQQQEDARRATAERQAAEQAAQQAQRAQQDQERAQQRLVQQRQEEDRRAAAVRARSSDQATSFLQASLTLTNRDCRAADFYLDREKVATVGANSSQVLSIEPGSHLVRACQAGTSLCGNELPVNTLNGPSLGLAVNTQSSCGMPAIRFAMPAPLLFGVQAHRNGSLPFRTVRR